jgi:flagellin
MSLGVLNNISAVYAENYLNQTQSSLQTTLQQLSSGSRINSGADDAAGLSLADGLEASSTALTQSAQNATEGVDFLQVADGALSQVSNLLNRAVTLATEASNGTLNSSQQSAADAEYQNILTEINTINNTTEYNGINAFGSSAYSAVNASDSLTGALTVTFNDGTTEQFSTAQLGGGGGATSYTLASAASAINTYAADNSKATQVSAGNGQLVLTDGSVSGSITETLDDGAGAKTSLSVSSANSILTYTAGQGDNMTVTVDGGAAQDVAFTTGSLADLAADINTAAGSTVATVSGNTLNMASGSSFAIEAGDTLTETTAAGSTNNKEVAIFTSDGNLSTSYNDSASDVVTANAGALGLSGSTLTSTTSAEAALTAINAAVSTVAADRGTLGANMNTLTAVENVMTTQSTNTQSAQNDVTATDYGQASSNLSKYEILMQTGISALAQANSTQQLVTKLLQ